MKIIDFNLYSQVTISFLENWSKRLVMDRKIRIQVDIFTLQGPVARIIRGRSASGVLYGRQSCQVEKKH